MKTKRQASLSTSSAVSVAPSGETFPLPSQSAYKAELARLKRRVAAARDVSGAQVALAWLLGRPGVTSLVIGGRNADQFRDSLKSADLVLSAEERAELDAVSAPPLIYPYWHQNWTASDRLGPADFRQGPEQERVKRG